jgi:hypothetical protein
VPLPLCYRSPPSRAEVKADGAIPPLSCRCASDGVDKPCISFVFIAVKPGLGRDEAFRPVLCSRLPATQAALLLLLQPRAALAAQSYAHAQPATLTVCPVWKWRPYLNLTLPPACPSESLRHANLLSMIRQ